MAVFSNAVVEYAGSPDSSVADVPFSVPRL